MPTSALSAILVHWYIPPALLPIFLNNADGLAALALLCNAGTKDWSDRPADPCLYRFKAELVRWACEQAGRDRSWMDVHDGMTVYFIESGLHLDGQPLQLAFHFRHGDTLPDLANWPRPEGRIWRGQRAAARALDIAQAYLCDRGISG